ncbi:MAG: HNH endonuclease [Pirellulaceae bacterium]
MGDGATRGRSTDLGVGQEFANAVLYSLSDHPKATKRDDGIWLPIDDAVWQQVFKIEFPKKRKCKGKPTQSLEDYCHKYFNRGRSGIGYDNNGQRDFGTGSREGHRSMGKIGENVSGTNRAVHPGEVSHLKPEEVIQLATAYWESNRQDANGLFSSLAALAVSVNEQIEEIILDPIRREMVIEAFERKASWAIRARKLYGFECMISGCEFKLVKEDGEQYIEVHHITPMCEGGSPNDTKNLSVLCPNHHREIHYATGRQCKALTKLVRQEQSRRLANDSH